MQEVAQNLDKEIQSIIEQLTPEERKYFKYQVSERHGFRSPDYVFRLYAHENRSAQKIHESSLDVIEEILEKEEKRRLRISNAVKRLRA